MLDNEAWARPRDTARYPGNAGFADYVMGLYYRYLNLGFRMPPSAGSASGVLPNPVGYNRIYARLSGGFDAGKWYGAIRENHHFVTNGPMLFLETRVDGGRLRGAVEVRAREPLDRLEVIANGRVVETFHPALGARRMKQSFSLDARSYTWAAVRCFVRNADTVRLAHSSPVFLSGSFDASEDARYFMQWIDELIANTTAQRIPAGSDRQHLIETYRRAAEFYRAKLR